MVKGPFSTEQIEAGLQTGDIAGSSFIWWKGQREWMPINLWKSQLPTILDAQNQLQKPVWYIDVGASPMGPLTQAELIGNLRALEELSRVRIWAVGMKKWMSIFEMHDVMELIGISRRETDRAPLMGSVALSRSNDDPKSFMLRAASISINGLGLSGAHDLRRGDEVAMLVKSTELASHLHVRGTVIYVTEAGYAGIRFTTANSETQSLIFDYVKRFNMTIEDNQSVAS